MKLDVRANADTADDASKAYKFGAKGVGLFRIEHMFYSDNSRALDCMREMIASHCSDSSIEELKPHIKDAVKNVLELGKPVTIRLIDPPLHEFVNDDSFKEVNPMLGHRGVRLGITYPKLTEMQIRAVFEAADELKKAKVSCNPEIMIPLVVNCKELNHQKMIFDAVALEYDKVSCLFGTMVETPAAALNTGELAEIAEFISFGTNDLTQMTLGFSRDDVSSFLPDYLKNGILRYDPFTQIHDSVKSLIQGSISAARKVRRGIKIGICGEQALNEIQFCMQEGMDYVSCSTFSIPAAKLEVAKIRVAEEL